MLSNMLKSVVMPDTYTDGTNTASHNYPYLKVANPANGRTRAPFTPFVTGVTQFDLSATSTSCGLISSGGTLASGGLSVTKTGAFTNYTYRAGDMWHVTSGTGATVGDYPIASRTNNDTIVLSTSAGAGGGASNLVGYIHSPQNDPIIIVGGYNVGGPTSASLLQSGEFSAGWCLETDYLRPDANFRRDAELYYRFCKNDGLGGEIRPFNASYCPDTHKLTEMGIAVADDTYGGTLGLFTTESNGTRTPIGNFAKNNWNLLGYTGANTGITVFAPAGRDGSITLVGDGQASNVGVKLTSTNSAFGSLAVGGTLFARFYKATASSGLMTINIADNSHSLYVKAPDSGWGGSAGCFRAASGNASDILKVVDTSGNLLWSVTTGGVQTVKTGTLAVGASQGSANLSAPFTNVTGADGTAKGVTLPTAVAGLVYEGVNASASTMKLYPASGDNLIGGGTNAGVNTALTIAAYSTFRCIAYDATDWGVVVA